MAANHTEQEDIERIKTWWADNGKAVLLGIGLGLVMIAGWKGWTYYVESQAQAAAQITSEFEVAQAAKNVEQMVKLADKLQQEHSGSFDASRAALLTAKHLVEPPNATDKPDLDKALAYLNWVANNVDDDGIQATATLRAARILWAQNKAQQALEKLTNPASKAFTGVYAQLEGDIYAEQGKKAEAKASYESALAFFNAQLAEEQASFATLAKNTQNDNLEAVEVDGKDSNVGAILKGLAEQVKDKLDRL